LLKFLLRERDRAHTAPPVSRTNLAIRRQMLGGYFQWVLDAACETVEWPYQPLGFNSLALRSALDHCNGSSLICAKVDSVSQAVFSLSAKASD
jgi:hypothetical protein